MSIEKNIKQRIQVIKGVSYVYEDHPYWDKKAKQNRHRREYIGKLGQEGEFLPNKRYLARQEEAEEKGAVEKAITAASRQYYGGTHLLDEISRMTGIEEDLKACFPNSYKMLLSIAYYLVLESDSPMYRFGRWAHDHKHPYGEEMSSQRISELMREIPESSKLAFFKMQSRRRQEKEYLAYDTTSVSSWSEYIKAVRYGKNKDHDELPQVNMALVFGEESSLPVYYRVLPGNITDVVTLRKLLKDVRFLEIDKLKLVMDRGLYSAENINALYKGHHKFLIATKANNSFVSGLVGRAKKEIHDFAHYDADQEVYYMSSMEKWPYEQKDRHGDIAVEEERRIYVHVYYNGQRAEDEKVRFTKALAQTEAAIRARTELKESQSQLMEKYFIIEETPKRGMQIRYKNEEIQRHMEQFGYFVLLSNDIKDPQVALTIYRKKDLVEKAFDNLKERLEMRRTGVHSDRALAGKFFLQFLALIFISYIHKHMHDNGLYQNYTMQSLLDTLDVIERYDYDGQRFHCSEVTLKQRSLFTALGASSP